MVRLVKNKSYLINRAWNSPTFNTWLSYSTRALSLFIVLPLILKTFSEAEVALWYLFATIIAMQGLADLGFRSTFIRIIAFAIGGAKDINLTAKAGASGAFEPNWALVGRIFSMMKKIYIWLALIFLILLLSFGSWSMMRPISMVDSKNAAWIGWFIIACVSAIKFYGTIYSNYLEGLNKIALVRRWEAITSTGAILTSILVLLTFQSLLALIIANQIWVLINFLRDYKLSQKVENAALAGLSKNQAFDKVFFQKIWAPAWRSGLSGLMSNGLSGITSILYAQLGSAANIASYLLALRLIAQVRDISMAPFYSKIPMLAKLRSQGKTDELISNAQRGMFLSNMVFVLGAVFIGLSGEWLLNLIGSKVGFIPNDLWLLLVLAYFIHRYGAMHIQLYSTTNHIISHIADGVSGVIFIAVTWSFIGKYDLYAIPVGMIAGYLGFYAWYAAKKSLSNIGKGFFEFEKKTLFLPLILLIGYFIYLFLKLVS